MAKSKVINQNSLVSEIMTVGGVNKENATSIFNIFTNAWNTDRIGMLKAVDTGIAVKRPATRKAPAKKVVKKAVTVKTKAPAKKKKVVAKKAKTSPVATVKTKSKGKKKLKAKKAKNLLPATTKSTTTNATA